MNKITLTLLLVCAVLAQQEYVELYSAFGGDKIDSADGWIVNGGSTTKFADQVLQCGSKQIFGGPKGFGKGTVVTKEFQLPPHFQVKVNVNLWRVDKWVANRMFIYVDGNMWETMWNTDTPGTKQCSAPATLIQSEHAVEYVITHHHASLTIMFGTSAELPINQQSFGFRDFKISYVPCPTVCGTCLGSDEPLCKMWDPIGMSFFTFKDDKDKEGWELKKGKDLISNCAGVSVMGGMKNYYKNTELVKIIQGLKPHYRIKVMFQFWKFDLWEGDSAQLYVDRQVKWSQVFGANEGETLCPQKVTDTTKQRPFNVNFESPHYYDAVNLVLTSSVTQVSSKAGWGVRQFYAYVALCAEKCSSCTGPEIEDCNACETPFVLAEDGTGCKLVGNWEVADKDFASDKPANAAWQVTAGLNGPDYSTVCSGIKMYGGYEKFGIGTVVKRKFTLPEHKRVRLTFEAWKIDDWFGESFLMKADGVQIFERRFGMNDPGMQDICGGSGFENMVKVDVIIGHETPEFNLLLTTDLKDNKVASWAIRNFILYIEKPDECATLYTECNYQGKSFNMCKDEGNFLTAKYPSKVKSIQIPQGFSVELFDEHDFKGGKIVYTQNQKCIETYDYKFLQVSEPSVVLTFNAQQ